ncbi:hypothetical protein BD309DRAFT_1030729 [Dichomitus squalens]|uniref:uncharacterized protein n=1 Tax=Dichomitus squalens (strain LYAD-421) TaxID=732165 RepID=UPI0004414747|nr:uncharacterized protein DICSQDRAFT_160579 [Dichomitus squalens LYAD-421 SS1]EJF63413.1 hypothetical protein DICSQDRAFT_160579 [Dichomitus squalens LYAD-421 SS1]TBU43579.1 hypothetical protein BD309DRAFT_1030729 [Dichomitus squalens]
MSSRPQPPSSSRSSSSPPAPKTIKLSPHALLALPHRLTHPPPPQPKKTSSTWGITPHFRIPLQEILDRKHLPPLGLKDFEEWLLFIDRMPECLYFILWLREYKSRYTAWRRQSKPSSPIRCSSSPGAPTYRSVTLPPPPNPALAQFYMRAKETFLTPYAPYALPVHADLLASFSSSLDLELSYRRPSNFSIQGPDPLLTVPGQPPPPPYPEIFEELEERVTAMLSESLDRFVLATFHNVGMPRAYCGCAGGTVIGLTGSAPILLANFLTGGSRWWRFSALPGLWLGMTIVISAMYGVCMMIYVFGDLRQLRSFELARVSETEGPGSSSSAKEKKLIHVGKLSSSHPAPEYGADSKGSSIRPLTGPPPPLFRQSVFSDSATPPRSPATDVSVSPLSRPAPPKLRVVAPPPAHTFTHVQTSSRAEASQTKMSPIAFASTSHSPKADISREHLGTNEFLCHLESDYSDSDSEYESDCETGSEADASSEASHDARAAATDATAASNNGKRPRARRRRRREPEIHISDAIFDEEPCPEGPATADAQERRRSSVWGESSDEDVGSGATFIHPFRWDQLEDSICSHDLESQADCAAEHQRIDAFDFDGLPKRSSRHSRSDSAVSPLPSAATPTFATPALVTHTPAVNLEKPSRGVHFASGFNASPRPSASAAPARPEAAVGLVYRFLGYLQSKCGPRNVAMYFLGAGDSTSTVTGPEGVSVHGSERPTEVRGSLSGPTSPTSPTSTLSPPSLAFPTAPEALASEKSFGSFPSKPKAHSKESWRKRVRRMLQVPAFASPLTPVLNPIVTRGQWEIVVRSAIIAFVLSASIVGGLVGAPETRVT